MKRVIIVHGLDGYYSDSWLPWLKAELQNNQIQTILPDMPTPSQPNLKDWLFKLNDIIEEPDPELILVGHSLGCITILRYLESLKTDVVIKQVALVAGFTSDLGFDTVRSFFVETINWDKIKYHSSKFIAFNSDNDHYVSPHYGDFFRDNLDAELILEKGHGHFSVPDDVFEMPHLLEKILLEVS